MSLYNKIIDLQKLNAAWDHVRKNKPAPGADNMTCEQFQENRREELKQLQIELREHKYEAVPVRNVTVYKNEKNGQLPCIPCVTRSCSSHWRRN